MMEMIELTVKDAVLQALEQARGTRLSGGWLAEQLGVSRAAVHKAIAALRESGLAIDAVTGEGYRLASDDDSLTAAGINALLDTAVIGREILVEPSLTSSNTTMKEQYLGRRHGFTLFAEEQTGGRGRLGRTFVSPADTGVYMTILLHPTLPLSHLSFVTISAAIAVGPSPQPPGRADGRAGPFGGEGALSAPLPAGGTKQDRGTARTVPRGIYPSITSSSIITRKPHMTLAVPTWECSPRWASGISSSTTT